jgi:hypothetical protein
MTMKYMMANMPTMRGRMERMPPPLLPPPLGACAIA